MSTAIPPSTSSGLSSGVIAGIVIAACAALSLSCFLLYRYVYQKNRGGADVEKDATDSGMTQVKVLIDKSYKSSRPLSHHDLTLPITLPRHPSLPAVPAATQYPAAPRSPHALAFDNDLDYTATTPNPFKASMEREGSISVSRSSILGSRKSSISSLASTGSLTLADTNPASPNDQKDAEVVQVYNVFRPLLPDELVLQPNERLTLIRSFDDGWCVVGRKSPFYAPAPTSPTSAAFGKGAGGDEIEIGAVPSWVFDKNVSSEMERPIRTTSMGVNVVVSDSSHEDTR